MGFDSPSRHHLKCQYPMWNQRLAALVSALCFGHFRGGSALRYEFRYKRSCLLPCIQSTSLVAGSASPE
jgi:hypothetical protein